MRYDFAQLEFRWTEHWIWQAHENQSFLGRTVFRLRRETMGSLADLTDEEWQSLHAEIRIFERFLGGCFKPDRFNYAQLGNIYPRLHVHAVPRYSAHREWGERMFRDTRWGKNWAPTPKSPLTVEQTYEFARWLGSELNQFCQHVLSAPGKS